jgi:hypothetical protein
MHDSNSTGRGEPSRQGRFLGGDAALLKLGALCEAGAGGTHSRSD